MFNLTTNFNMENESSINHSTPPDAKHLLGEVLSLERAKTLAIIKKCKIRHRFYAEDEFIEYKNSEWVTEDGYVLPKGYFESMSGEWLQGWSVHFA